ncbi:MAG TPA: hypothetical protein VF898_05190, partial [Chloroflexota bacterium]
MDPFASTGPSVAVACLLAAGALVLGRLGVTFVLSPDQTFRFDIRTTLPITLVGTACLLVTPTAFAAQSVANGNGAAWLPQAGPNLSMGFGPGRPGGVGGPPSGTARFGPPIGVTARGASITGQTGTGFRARQG